MIWLLLFTVGAFMLVPSAVGAVFDFGAWFPWLALSIPCMAIGAFMIWTADHPETDPRAALRAWFGRVAAGAASVVAVIVALAYPEIAIAVILVWILLMIGLAFLLSRLNSSAHQKQP